jgi:hypothetical protein
VLFSSITARLGRAGQVDYAMANEVLNKLAQREARRRSGCRVVAVNWGPWDGGMVTDPLKKRFAEEGVGLLDPAAACDYLIREIGSPARDVEVVVTATPLPEARPAAAPPAGGEGRVKGPATLPVAFERVLTTADHPVLRSHVIDGRPVLPMALILEWLAHGALHLNPGLLFVGCDDLRVLHGVILDGPPPTLGVGAGKAEKDEGFYRVPVELRGRRPDGREVLHARAVVLLAAELPPAPPAAVPLPCGAYPRSPDEAYHELLFHGPELRGLERIDGADSRGISGAARAAPLPSAWMRQPLRQKWLADPLVLDAGFQLMVLWSFEQRDAGSLPCHAARYRQYRRAFPADGCRIAARVTRSTNLHALADLEYLDAAGLLVARLEGYECTLDAGLRRAFRRNEVERAC